MPTRSWKKRVETAERRQAGRGGWVNGAVMIVLVVAVAVTTARVMAPPGWWESLRRNLPARWNALRDLLQEGDLESGDLVPLESPAPTLPTPEVTPLPSRP